jgi:hypothetical protein
MKTLIPALLLVTSASAFAGDLECTVVRNETLYVGTYQVKATEHGISLSKNGKLIASGPSTTDQVAFAYELKRNALMIEDGAEVYLSSDWSDRKGGRMTIVDRTRDVGNVSTAFECRAE